MSTRPHYFGPPDAPLFACYHAAASAAASCGVLVCNPIGHEYMACYRALRQAAMRLAQAGVPALRFDFYGAGDSSGESADGCPSRWLRDIGMASEQLRQEQGRSDIAFLGWRMGATLALLATQETEPPRAAVLWDPIVRGDAYVAELTILQKERFGGAKVDEILGFPFTRALRSELEAIDLLKVDRAPAHVLLVETGPAREDTRAVAERLTAVGAAVERCAVAGGRIWHEPNKASVPAGAIQSIVAWVRNRSC